MPAVVPASSTLGGDPNPTRARTQARAFRTQHTPALPRLAPAAAGMPLEAYTGYLDLRKYGTVPHSGGWQLRGS